MGERIFESTAKGVLISPEQLLTKEDIVRLKSRVVSLKQRTTLPPITTHNVVDDISDEILNLIRKHKLFNHRDDKVSINTLLVD